MPSNSYPYTATEEFTSQRRRIKLNKNGQRLESALSLLNRSLKDQRDLVVSGLRVNEIVSFFEGELGYACEINADIAGESGAIHHFDIIANKDCERIVIDIVQLRSSILDSFASEVDAQEELVRKVVEMRAKSWDCKIDFSVVLRVTSFLSLDTQGNDASNEFQLFLQEQNIEVVEAPDIKTATVKIKESLNAVEVIEHA